MAFLAMFGRSTPVLSQAPDESPQEQNESVSEPFDPIVIVLMSQETTADDRRAAAASLLDSRRFGPLGMAIEAGDPRIVPVIFQTIFEIGDELPVSLINPTINHILAMGADSDPAAVQALAGVRTKPAITPVVGLFQDENASQTLIETALSTLLEQTGREDLGNDPDAWTAWWEEARWLPPREWEAMQAAAHAERARRLQRETDRQFARILELQRRLYALTPQDQRSLLLATMMGEEELAVRLLAFELSELALLNTQRLDEQVLNASVERLSDSDSQVRAAAASLLFRLGAEDEAIDTVRRVLRHETNPDAAASMLIFLGRSPNESDQLICLSWLDGAEPAATAAARTLLSSINDGVLSRPRERSEALTALRAMDTSRLTSGKIALLGIIGESSDRRRLQGLLRTDTDPAIRRAASIALVRWPSSVASLVNAVSYDHALLQAYTDALIQHQATPAGYRLLADLSSSVPLEALASQLLRLRRAMPPTAALDSISPDEIRHEALESVLFESGSLDLTTRDPRFIITQALILARYNEGDDPGVVDLLNRIDSSSQMLLSHDVRVVARRSLISMGRFDDAVLLGAAEVDWQAALDRSQSIGATETAQSIMARMDAMFPGGSISQDPDGTVTTSEDTEQNRKPDSGLSEDSEGLQNGAVTLEPSTGGSEGSGG